MAAAPSDRSSDLYKKKEELIDAGLKESKLFIVTEVSLIKLSSGIKIISLTPSEESLLLSDDKYVKERVAKASSIIGYSVVPSTPKAGTGSIVEILYLLISDGKIVPVEIKSTYACAARGEIVSVKLVSVTSSDSVISKAATQLLFAAAMGLKGESNDYSELNYLLPMKYDRTIDFKINARILNKLWN